jgi:hypothetical protein
MISNTYNKILNGTSKISRGDKIGTFLKNNIKLNEIYLENEV